MSLNNHRMTSSGLQKQWQVEDSRATGKHLFFHLEIESLNAACDSTATHGRHGANLDCALKEQGLGRGGLLPLSTVRCISPSWAPVSLCSVEGDAYHCPECVTLTPGGA